MGNKIIEEKRRKWNARRTRTRRTIGRTDRVMLTIFRSSKHIYAQLIDTETGATVGTASTRSKGLVDGNTGNVEAAKRVGTKVAEIAKSKNIDQVVFNRNGFLYHGRVRALAEAAREAGLHF